MALFQVGGLALWGIPLDSQRAFPLKRNGAWETIPPFRVWAYIQGAMLVFNSLQRSYMFHNCPIASS